MIKLALVAAVLTVAVPLILLTLAALIVGIVVLTVGGLVAAGIVFLKRPFTSLRPPSNRSEGRVNVRILHR